MPENVTRFQPIENVKKPLIRWTYIDIMPSRLPTFFHEEPIFDISKIAGTGVTNIEQRYGHFDQSMARSVALKNFSFSRDGISSRVEHGD